MKLRTPILHSVAEWGAKFFWPAVTALILIYTFQFSCRSIRAFESFGMFAYDFGIHVQAVWRLAFEGELFNTVRGMNVLGDHLWMIFFPMAALYRWFPDPNMLLVLQAFGLAAGAWALAALGRKTTGSQAIGILLAGGWLLSPVLQFMNLDEFHPEVIAASFLLAAVYFAEERRWVCYAIALSLAAGSKEDVAITVSAYGMVLLLTGHKRVGVWTIALSAIYFVLSLKVILPWFNGHGFFRTTDGYWFSELWRNKFSLSYYLQVLSRPQLFEYTFRLFFPLGLVALLRPIYLIPVVPSFFINILSGNVYLMSIEYHYNNQTLPMLFVAATYGLAAMSKLARLRKWAMPAAAGLLGLTFVQNVRHPRSPLKSGLCRFDFPYSAEVAELRGAIEEISANRTAVISATYNVVPHLAHRAGIYMFPNPYHRSYWGIGHEPYSPDASTVDLLVLDLSILEPTYQRTAQSLLDSGMYRLRRKIAKAVIYERDPDYSSSMANGSFRLRIWEDDGEAKSLDPLPLGPPIREVKAPNLDFPHTNGELRTQMGQSIGRSDNVVLIADASISAFGETPIILRARADDGVRVFVNDQLVINRPSTHSFGVDLVSDLIQLRPGPNRFRVEYFEWGGPAGLLVEWRPINEESYKVLTAAQALP